VQWYPDIANRVKITLIEALPHVLPSYSKELVAYTEKHFVEEKVEILTNTQVKEVLPKSLLVAENHIIGKKKEVIDGVETEVDDIATEMKEIPYGLLVWATGNTLRPLTKAVISQLPRTSRTPAAGW